jgi:integrase
MGPKINRNNSSTASSGQPSAKELRMPLVLPSGSKRQRSHKDQADSSEAQLWVRLEAFLSMRSPNTYTTYLGILREWSQFLGAKLGEADSAERLLSVEALHGMAYLNFLSKRPGETPRSERSAKSAPNRVRSIARPPTGASFRAKSSGLESTQSNSTISKKVAALRRIYRMLIGAGLFSGKNPFDSDTVRPPPKESGRKRPTEMLSFSLVKQILGFPPSDTPKGKQDRAILAVLFGGALRRGEARNLRISDVRRTPRGTTFLYLRATKAGKDASQAIPEWAAKPILDHVRWRMSSGARDNDYLFCSFRGKGGATPTQNPISSSGIYKLFVAIASRVEGAGWITPHSARATAITKLLADGIPHREVKEFSRHASIQMVELYDKRRISVDANPARGLSFDDD